MRLRAWIGLGVVVGTALVGREARAEGEPFELGAQPAWYLLGGVTSGATMLATNRGGYVGGELSLARLGRGGRFVGLYGDGYYDIGAKRTYATLGPEIGYKFVGIDGGVATRFGASRVEWGGTGRVFVTIGVLAIYARYAYFGESLGRDNDNVLQVGALVKLPVKVWGIE